MAYQGPEPEPSPLREVQEAGDYYSHQYWENIQKLSKVIQTTVRIIENEALKQPNNFANGSLQIIDSLNISSNSLVQTAATR